MTTVTELSLEELQMSQCPGSATPPPPVKSVTWRYTISIYYYYYYCLSWISIRHLHRLHGVGQGGHVVTVTELSLRELHTGCLSLDLNLTPPPSTSRQGHVGTMTKLSLKELHRVCQCPGSVTPPPPASYGQGGHVGTMTELSWKGLHTG